MTPGNGQNGNGGTNENIENGLQVTASTTVINADGQDAARINVYYDKVKLSLDAVAFYDAKSNDVLDLSKFTIEDNTLVADSSGNNVPSYRWSYRSWYLLTIR